jgi:hypothetical protein
MNTSNKYIKKKYCYLILFLISAIQQFSFAQIDTTKTSNKIKKHGLQAGYIVKQVTGDTVQGLVKKHSLFGTDVEYVSFKLKKENQPIFYREDSIIAFGYGNIIYRYFENYGWCQLIATGDIMLYQGHIPSSGFNTIKSGGPGPPMMSMQSRDEILCYIFIKNKRFKAISSHEIMRLQTESKTVKVLKKETINNFKEFISDNPQVLAEFLSIDFRFEHLPALIDKYNMSKKMQSSVKTTESN